MVTRGRPSTRHGLVSFLLLLVLGSHVAAATVTPVHVSPVNLNQPTTTKWVTGVLAAIGSGSPRRLLALRPGNQEGPTDVPHLAPQVDSELTIRSARHLLQTSVTAIPSALEFPEMEVSLSMTKSVTIKNTGAATIHMTALSPPTGPFKIVHEDCMGSVDLPTGDTCLIRVAFTPTDAGAASGALEMTFSNEQQLAVNLAGTGVSLATKAVSLILNSGGFPNWYQDERGVRVEPCLDPNDANCGIALPLANGAVWPYQFPTNYPDEFFYANAMSDILDTDGCGGLPGKVFVTMALEGAFINTDPIAGDQMTFGRTRFTATGLCPNSDYTFEYPYGTTVLRTNGLGTVIRGVGTTDVGCVPAAGVTCDFSKALSADVFGLAKEAPPLGFLRWDPAAAPPVPAGYLGDGVTPHEIVGGTERNSFKVTGKGLPAAGLSTNKFIVIGKLAGPLMATPSVVDFAGIVTGQSSEAVLVTITNQDVATLTLGAVALGGSDAASYAITADSCSGQALPRLGTCTVTLTLTPITEGEKSAVLRFTHTLYNSPFDVQIKGMGVSASAAAGIGAAPASHDFGRVRIRTVSDTKQITITNTGSAPLVVTGVASNAGANPGEFVVALDQCSKSVTEVAVRPGGTCRVDLRFRPRTNAGDPFTGTAKSADVHITSNVAGTQPSIAVQGQAWGGIASVSTLLDATQLNRENGFPLWYRDEQAITFQQCIDPKDPYCIVLADPTYDPSKALSFLNPADPTGDTMAGPLNYPGEFFYTVTENVPVDVPCDPASCPGCDPNKPGSVMIRHAVEAAFINGNPVPHEQMTFARVRVTAKHMCPNSFYKFVYPYGAISLETGDKGLIRRTAGTTDIGCTPIAPDRCDFVEALSGPIFGGFLRWDPAVDPPAPAGYAGDAINGHKAIGAPFRWPVGANTPANFVKVYKLANAQDTSGTLVAETEQFVIMGKYLGPLVATPEAVNVETSLGSTSSSQTVTLHNKGITPITLNSASVTGVDAADFHIGSSDCNGVTLAPESNTCTITVTFAPTATGTRTAGLTIAHTGLNNPFTVPLNGIGQAAGITPVINFVPRSLTFPRLKVGRHSSMENVEINNIGGRLPLQVTGLSFSGSAAADFTVVSNLCTAAIAPGGICTVGIVFVPTAAGPRSANLVVTDNAPGGSHSYPVSGTGFSGTSDVAASMTSYGYPTYYQDQNGVRVEPCVSFTDPYCVPGTMDGLNPNAAISITSSPPNFPGEFFYTLAASDVILTRGCEGPDGTLVDEGKAYMRLGLEGSFANTDVVNGDQITFTRVRVVATGLCPNVPYTFRTPYGEVVLETNAAGQITANAGVNGGTFDTGCGPVAPQTCTWSDALADPVANTIRPTANEPSVHTPIESFLRWDPSVAPAAPAGYLGDATLLHKVVGGTFIPPGENAAFNGFEIRDSAGIVHYSTDLFTVSGRVAGPLQSPQTALAFPNTELGQTSSAQTVSVTNIGESATGFTVTLGGVDSAQFVKTSNCPASLAVDATCTVSVQFKPTIVGDKTANLIIAPPFGPQLVVTLTGKAIAPRRPKMTLSSGILTFGSTTPNVPVYQYTTVGNTGDGNLLISSATITGPSDFVVDYAKVPPSGPANCGTRLAGGTITILPTTSCQMAVKFTPTVVGARTGTLTLKHNDISPGAPANGGTTAISLTATGTASTFTLTPSPTLDFANVNRGQTKTLGVTVKNTGSITFSLPTPTITGAQPNIFTVASTVGCQNLQPNKSCTINLNFRPVQATSYTATLTVSGDGTSLPATQSIGLTGTGR